MSLLKTVRQTWKSMGLPVYKNKDGIGRAWPYAGPDKIKVPLLDLENVPITTEIVMSKPIKTKFITFSSKEWCEKGRRIGFSIFGELEGEKVIVESVNYYEDRKFEVRKGSYATVFPSGNRIYVDDPDPLAFNIEDIAHHLSMQCRYNGGVTEFYSVAQHSVHVAECLYIDFKDSDLALAGLMHDAPEYVLGDIIRPLKHKKWMKSYYKTEEMFAELLAEKYKYDYPYPPLVTEYDNRILVNERKLRNSASTGKSALDSLERLNLDIECWPPQVAKDKFISMFWHLESRRIP